MYNRGFWSLPIELDRYTDFTISSYVEPFKQFFEFPPNLAEQPFNRLNNKCKSYRNFYHPLSLGSLSSIFEFRDPYRNPFENKMHHICSTHNGPLYFTDKDWLYQKAIKTNNTILVCIREQANISASIVQKAEHEHWTQICWCRANKMRISSESDKKMEVSNDEAVNLIWNHYYIDVR